MVIGKSLSIQQALRFGLDKWKENWGFLTGIYLFSLLVPAIPQAIIYNLSSDATFSRIILLFIHYILMIITSMGMVYITLRVARGLIVTFSDFFAPIQKFTPFLMGWMLYGLAIFVGFLFFIIPGIIFMTMFSLWGYFVIDREVSGWDSLQESKKAVYGVKWRIFGLVCISLLINLVGLLIFGIGLLFTVPITMLAWAFTYLQLTEEVVI